jgi:hypothetical protein
VCTAALGHGGRQNGTRSRSLQPAVTLPSRLQPAVTLPSRTAPPWDLGPNPTVDPSSRLELGPSLPRARPELAISQAFPGCQGFSLSDTDRPRHHLAHRLRQKTVLNQNQLDLVVETYGLG